MIDFNYAIFDLDGTLLDSEKVWRTIEIRVAEELGGVKVSEADFNELINLTFFDIMHTYEKKFGVRIDIDKASVLTNERMCPNYINGNIAVKPTALEYLNHLKSSGIKTALATATPKFCCEPYLEASGLNKYFDFVFTTLDDAKAEKNESARVYDLALEALGGTKENTVIFEDSLYAIKTAKKNGYFVIGVSDHSQEAVADEVKKLADIYIDSYKELIEYNGLQRT